MRRAGHGHDSRSRGRGNQTAPRLALVVCALTVTIALTSLAVGVQATSTANLLPPVAEEADMTASATGPADAEAAGGTASDVARRTTVGEPAPPSAKAIDRPSPLTPLTALPSGSSGPSAAEVSPASPAQAETPSPTPPTLSATRPTPSATEPSPSPTSPGASATSPTPSAPVAPDCAAAKCIALTFDDGPVPDTGRLLDVLAAKGVRATFFALGTNVVAHPDVAARIVAEGHVLGNHTWDHRSMVTLTEPEIDAELVQTREAIVAATGTTPLLMRPPYGAVNDVVMGRVGAVGEAAILWNVDSRDWDNRDVAVTTQRVVEAAAPGAIVLLHDIHPSTVDAVPGIVDALQAQGYVLVTVPELFGGAVAPGAKHFSQSQ